MQAISKSLVAAAAIAIAVHVSTIGIAQHLPRQVRTPQASVTREYRFPAVPLVRLDHLDGAITVSTHDLPEIVVTARINAFTDRSEATAAATAYAESLPKVHPTDMAIVLVSEPTERPDAVDVLIDYTISVPRGTALDLKLSRGNVVIGSGCGEVQVAGNNSDVDISSPLGAVRVMTTNGRIRVANAGGDVTLRTVNGNVSAVVRQGRIQATTTVGRIDAQVTEPSLQSLNLTAKNGDITLLLPVGLSADVHALAARGRVYADLAESTATSAPPAREYRGMLGGGAAPITVTAENGNIRLQRSSTS